MRKMLSLSLLALTLTLASCSGTGVDDSSSGTSDSSSPVQTVENKSVVAVPSPYGSFSLEKEKYAVGEEVDIRIVSSDPSLYAPYGAYVNGELLTLGSNDTLTATMVESGLVVRPIFARVLTDFTLSANDTTIFAEQIDGAEYSLDGGEWQDSNIFTGVTDGVEHTVSVRLRAEGDLEASEEVTKTIVTQASYEAVDSVLFQLQFTDVAFQGDLDIYQYVSSQSGTSVTCTEFDNSLIVGNDRYYINSDFADDGTNKLRVDVVKGDDGDAYAGTLNYDNTVTLTSTGETYAEKYANPFADVLSTDFTRVGPSRLSYNCERDTELSERLAKYLTDHDGTLTSLFIDTDENNAIIGLDATVTYGSSSADYAFNYWDDLRLKVVDADQLDYCRELSADYDQSILSTTLESLREGNYTADITVTKQYQSDVHEVVKVADGGVLVKQDGSYAYGFHETENGLTAYDVTSKDGTPVLKERFGYPHEGDTLDDLIPQFDVDPSLFSRQSDVSYTLKDNLNIYSYAYRLAPDTIVSSAYIADIEEGSLKLNLTEDGVDITYDFEDIYGYSGTVTAVITDIGSTTPEYDFDSAFQPFTTPTSWAEYNQNLYDLLAEFVEDPDKIPFLWNEEYGISDFGRNVTGSEVKIDTTFPTRAEAEEHLAEYEALMVESGYTEGVEDGVGDNTYTDGKNRVYFSLSEQWGTGITTFFMWVSSL